MQGKNLLISVGDWAVEVTESVKGVGYCFDYFNYNATDFLEEMFSDANFDFTNNGLWLYHNSPAFTDNNATATANPFENIPFWPGQKDKTYAGSLPP